MYVTWYDGVSYDFYYAYVAKPLSKEQGFDFTIHDFVKGKETDNNIARVREAIGELKATSFLL